MFKNIIIAALVVVILNLLVQNKQNIDILINDMATAKQKIDRATIYLEDVIDENFPPKEFEVETNYQFKMVGRTRYRYTIFTDRKRTND